MMSQLIRNWEELSKIPSESATHILEVDVESCCGWLIAKNPKPYKRKYNYMRQAHHLDHYLSTHTFYGHQHKFSTKLLRVCGFDVEIYNWDSEVANNG